MLHCPAIGFLVLGGHIHMFGIATAGAVILGGTVAAHFERIVVGEYPVSSVRVNIAAGFRGLANLEIVKTRLKGRRYEVAACDIAVGGQHKLTLAETVLQD